MNDKVVRVCMRIAVLCITSVLMVVSCLTEKEIQYLAVDEKELPRWRFLARTGEEYSPYIKWKESLIKELFTGSTVIDTREGPEEYTVDGDSGPYVYGSPGGYDQTEALFSDMLGKGFRVLSWSRPGYLRTPLEDGAGFQGQADVAAALIDYLGIDRVAVLGYSAGGHPAIYFSTIYPDRVWALILECAVTRRSKFFL